jgi:hypothetical protein
VQQLAVAAALVLLLLVLLSGAVALRFAPPLC